jgi:hypothetical protein
MALLKPRFDYSSLKRTTIDGKRHYSTPTGEPVPSVTTILDATKNEEKKQKLQEWRARVGHEKAQQITTESANRGTRMHSHLEHYVEYGALKERGSNPFGWAAHAMAETVVDQGLTHMNEVWGIEVGLFFPQVYAGTTDGVGIHSGDEAIIDYKQTNKPKSKQWIEDYFLQLAAYAECHNEMFGTAIRKGVIMMCVKPDVDAQCNIISPPKYQEFILTGDEFEKYRQEWWKRVERYYMLRKT